MAIRPKKQMPANKGETGGGAPRSSYVVSGNVKVVGKRPSGPNSGKPLTEGKMLKGAEQARAQNMRALASKPNAKALKAANKPTNKVGSKADKALRSRTKSVSMSKDQAVKSYDAMYGKGAGKTITQVNKSVAPKNEARSVRKMPKKK